ncbi:GAF and ANTAR domain-containing protein [Mycobacterium sp.]|uniref:GAF and ANTAR domain-containing protein n=1 Tax=Mycobacterium sp. TaxID=1785 RepID=UPI002B72F12A|nr:GAF and ANTAR domain-containing protein [Mycobacterium sp.]HTY32262.1 GAF and ANTAR domain-containing protein [Mycobacterium sp.]
MTGPQPALANSFVELADTLVADFDLIDFFHLVTVRTQQTLGVEAVGLLVADNHGGLNVVAASSEQARVLELFQLQHAEGPCLDCYRSGRPVSCPDLSTESDRWPHFVPKALDIGFAAVHAVPMRLRDEVIGGMNLFTATRGCLDPERLAVAQALTDVAAIGLLQERAISQRDLLTEQLQTALNNRLSFEQAKGILAERGRIMVGEASELLRRYARRHNRKVTDVADAVVRNDPAIADLVDRVGGIAPID